MSARATCPPIEPLPSTANAVIEDRNRAPGATVERVQPTPLHEPHELLGLAGSPFPISRGIPQMIATLALWKW